MGPVISLVNSRIGPSLGILLARVLPRNLASAFADWVAGLAASGVDTPVVRAIRANQAVVRGVPYDHPGLQRAAAEVLQYAARGYLAFYRALARGRLELRETCRLDPVLESQLHHAADTGRGVVIATAHMGNFDLAFHTLMRRGLSPLVLSYRVARGSYKADNAIRRRYGLEAKPVSVASLREAIERLRSGGRVLTGVDRPDEHGRTLDFFGRPATLPVGHARLAMKTGSLLQPGVALDDGEGGYRLVGPPALEPPAGVDEDEGALWLSQRVLETLEAYIRNHPAQWLMYFPVWPEAMPGSAGA